MTFKANCAICGKQAEYSGKEDKKAVTLCSEECKLAFNENHLKLQKKRSKLPQWLFDRGVIDIFPNVYFRNREERRLMQMKKELKKAKLKEEKENLALTISHIEEVLKHPNTMYMADDVEKIFKKQKR